MPDRTSLPSPYAKPGRNKRDLSKGGITAEESRQLPLVYLQRMDTWRLADVRAKAEIRERSIESLAQSLNDKDEHNMRQIVKRYPNISPGILQGLAQGVPQVMPDETTAEPFSDQGDSMTKSLNAIYRDDIASSIAEGTYGATSGNPLPQHTSMGAIVLGGSTGVSSDAKDYSAEGVVPDQQEGWFDQIFGDFFNVPTLQDVKDRFSGGLNVAFAIPDALNAATETSAGNEQLMRELNTRYGLSADDARDIYGQYGMESTLTQGDNVNLGVQPGTGAGVLVQNWLGTQTQTEGSTDATVPQADLSVPLEERKRQAAAEWRQHLIDTEQINPETGEKSFGNITGRTTLGQQERLKQAGEDWRGGWFGGGSEEVEKRKVGLAGRQSDIRTYAERQEAKREADRIRSQYRAVGQDLTLDEYTMLTSPRTWTEGRAFTGMLDMSPGSKAEMAVSGLVDLVFTLGTDPTTYIPVGLMPNATKRAIYEVTKQLQRVPYLGRLTGRAPWFEADELLRRINKGEDIAQIEDTMGASAFKNAKRTDNLAFTGGASGRSLVDQAGNAVPNSPVLTRSSAVEKFDNGYTVTRVNTGRSRPVWEVAAPGEQPQRFATRRDARNHVRGLGGKNWQVEELWDVAGGSTGKKLADAETEAREVFLRSQGISQSEFTTSRTAWDMMTNSYIGQQFTTRVAKMTNPYEIRRRMGNKISTASARRLAAAQTPEEVRAVMSSLLGTEVKEAGALRAFSGVRASAYDAKIKMFDHAFTRRTARALSLAPKAVPIDITDTDEVVDNLARLGTSVGMKQDEIARIMGDIINADSSTRVFDIVHDDFVHNAFRKQLVKNGVDDARAGDLLQKVKLTTDSRLIGRVTPSQTKQYMRRSGAIADVQELMAARVRASHGALSDNSVAAGTFIKGIDDEVGLAASEMFAGQLMMPTAREIRREANKVAIMLRKSDRLGETVDEVQKYLGQSMDLWRNLTLANVSYIFRNIAEEVMTMGLVGGKNLLTHPVHTLGTIMGVHAQAQYSSGLRKVSQATSRAIPLVRAHRAMKYTPEKYKGVRLVDTQALRSLVTQQQGAQVNMSGKFVTARGRKVNVDDFIEDVRRGIVNPIEVTVDDTNGMYAVSDGVKRLLAAFDADDIPQIPVRIKAGRVTNGRSIRNRRPGMDITHDDLWGSAAGGTIEDAMEQGRRAFLDHLGQRRALRYVIPYFDSNMANAVGDSWLGGIETAMRTGDNAGLERMMAFTTRMRGSALRDEHPEKLLNHRRVFDQSGRKIDMLWPTENDAAKTMLDPTSSQFTNYVESYADVMSEIAATGDIRRVLAGEITLDDLTAEILRDPRRMQDFIGTVEAGVYATADRAIRRGKMSLDPDDIMNYHMDNLYDLVHGVLSKNYEDAGRYLGTFASPKIRQIVVDGRFAGKPLNSKNKKLRAVISKEIQDNQSFREALPGLTVSKVVEPALIDRWASAFFATAGNMRDMITLHPLMRDTYLDEVKRLSKFMTPQAKDDMVNAIRRAGDDKFAAMLDDMPAPSEGWLTKDIVHDLADRHTRKVAEETFYDAATRRNWAVALRWASPFAQAAVNSTYRWGKAMGRDPVNTYRTARSLNAIKDAMGEWVGVYEPELEDHMGVNGHLDRNSFGEEMFVYPLVGKLAALFGFDKSVASFSAESTNVFQTGVFTGLGPVAMFGLSLTPFRDVQSRAGVAGDIMRFFQPFPADQSPSGTLVGKAAEAFIPAKLVDLVNVDEGQVARLSKAILVARLQNGTYGPMEQWKTNQWQQIGDDLNNDARRLLRLEGISKLGLPLLGSFDYSPLIKLGKVEENMPEGVKGGAVLDYMVNAEYQAYVGNLSGDERTKAQALFMADYGDYLAALPLSTSEQTEKVYTNFGATTVFAREEQALYDKYRTSIGYLFPEGDYETQWSDFDRFQNERDKAKGIKTIRSPRNQVEYTKNYMLRWQKSQRIRQLVSENPDDLEEQVGNINDEFKAMGLDSGFSGYTDAMMQQVREAVEDPQVRDSVKAAGYVWQYFLARDKVVNHLKKNTDVKTLSSKSAWEYDAATSNLYLAATKLAGKDRGFANFWHSLAEKEFGDTPDEYLRRM